MSAGAAQVRPIEAQVQPAATLSSMMSQGAQPDGMSQETASNGMPKEVQVPAQRLTVQAIPLEHHDDKEFGGRRQSISDVYAMRRADQSEKLSTYAVRLRGINVPDGYGPGMKLEIEHPDTKEPLVVTIPEGYSAGQVLQITLDAPDDAPDPATVHYLASREPNSFHQATIYFGLVAQNSSSRLRNTLLFCASFAIVILQAIVAAGLMIDVQWTTCTGHDDCPAGGWCKPLQKCGDCKPVYGEGGEWNGYVSICNTTWDEQMMQSWLQEEGEYGELRGKEGTLDHGITTDMCSTCTDAEGRYISASDANSARVGAMKRSDWLALLLASMVIGYGIYGEVLDTLLCDISLRAIGQTRKVPRSWRWGVGILKYLRLFAFLPFVVGAAIQLVISRGGSVLSVCLNTVAVLFLVEIDNLAFSYGMKEQTRKECEEYGRVPVTADDERLLDAVKPICAFGIPCLVLFATWTENAGFAIFFSTLPFMAIVVVQSLHKQTEYHDGDQNRQTSYLCCECSPAASGCLSGMCRAACGCCTCLLFGLFVVLNVVGVVEPEE